ncbi:MAG TPA: hypothetical protein VIJ75_12850 [Hanamia sp.]
MRIRLLSLMLGITFICKGQVKPATFYFDKNLKPSERSGSEYTGKGRWEYGLYRLDLYDKKQRYLIFTAYYTDSTFAVQDGRFLSFYENGDVENISYFKKGMPDGLWTRWDNNKRIADSSWYTNGEPDSAVYYRYRSLNPNLDFVLRYNYHDSTMVRTRFDDNDQSLQHDATDFLRFGKDTIVAHPDVEVAYPGEDSTLQQYLQSKFDNDKYELLTKGTSGVCVVRFKVDKGGIPSDFKTIYCDNNSLANDMVMALRRVTWVPALKDNKPVAALKEVSTEYYPSLNSVVQKNKRRYLFDQNLNPADRDHSFYHGKIKADGNLVEFSLHDIQRDNRIFKMQFTDSSLETANGLFESFYYNDGKHVRGNFVLSRKNGVWVTWSQDGKVLDSSFYDIGALTSVTQLSYQPNETLAQRTVIDYTNRVIHSYYYDKGKCTSITAQDFTGKFISFIDSSINDVTTPPQFAGGDSAWRKYLEDYREKNKKKIHREGECVVRIRVDTSGNIISAEPLTLNGTSFSRFAVEALLTGPKWIPATKDGKKVEAYCLTVFYVRFLRVIRLRGI